MTLVIATTNAEGVVLTADSRQTYINRAGAPRIASDNATKILQLNDTVAVATAGQAFFSDSGKLRSIQSYLEDFRDTKLKGAKNKPIKTVLDIAQALDAFCQPWLLRITKATIIDSIKTANGTNLTIGPVINGKVDYEFKDIEGQIVRKEWWLPLPQFIVAGRDPDGVCHAISLSPFLGIGAHSTSEQPNMQWIGQTEVLMKLLTGDNPFVISTTTMTVQDAIDFAILLTRTTENIQKFSDGTAASQGGIPGVGGPIDVVFIAKKDKLQWLSRKQVHVEDSR